MNVVVYHVKNFRNITYVKRNGGAGVYCAISQLHNENHQWYCETCHPFPRAWFFKLVDVSSCNSLCFWTGLVIHWVLGFLLVGLWNEDNLKESVCRIFTNPVRIQDSQSPTGASCSLLHNRMQASGKL